MTSTAKHSRKQHSRYIVLAMHDCNNCLAYLAVNLLQGSMIGEDETGSSKASSVILV